MFEGVFPRRRTRTAGGKARSEAHRSDHLLPSPVPCLSGSPTLPEARPTVQRHPNSAAQRIGMVKENPLKIRHNVKPGEN